MSEIKYKRVMLKVSGEALAGPAHRGLDFSIINSVCAAIKECVDMGVQVGLMVGAGNFWRGVKDGADKMQRCHGYAGHCDELHCGSRCPGKARHRCPCS